jgi:uncharacterized surface protein with fasciclin (FAS1) repeats
MKRTRQTVLRTIGGGSAALLAGTAGTAAANGRRQGASGDATIVDIAAGDPQSRFDTLVAALQETGLDEVLASEDDQYTVFAPTDDAFAALLKQLGISAGALLARDDLANILLYHVTEGRRYASSVVNPGDIEMLNGGSVTTDGTTLNGGQAGIVATDIEASNGVVHVIDGVRLP